MSTKVENTGASGWITLFAKMVDNSYYGIVMQACQVGNPRTFSNAIDEVIVYIYPSELQLTNILAALNDGRMSYARLRDEHGRSIGSEQSGFTVIEY